MLWFGRAQRFGSGWGNFDKSEGHTRAGCWRVGCLDGARVDAFAPWDQQDCKAPLCCRRKTRSTIGYIRARVLSNLGATPDSEIVREVAVRDPPEQKSIRFSGRTEEVRDRRDDALLRPIHNEVLSIFGLLGSASAMGRIPESVRCVRQRHASGIVPPEPGYVGASKRLADSEGDEFLSCEYLGYHFLLELLVTEVEHLSGRRLLRVDQQTLERKRAYRRETNDHATLKAICVASCLGSDEFLGDNEL